MARIAMLVGALTVLLPLGLDRAWADHDGYKYKWPWYAGVATVVTSLPYAGAHQCDDPQTPEVEGSCTDAWDFDIPDYNVLSGAEGSVVSLRNDIPSSECNPLQMLGNNIIIEDPSGQSVIYAHLASVNFFLSFILQGDQVGNQGHTGYTVGNDPGTINGVPVSTCGDHLHWEFDFNNPSNPVHPTTINGEVSNSFDTKTSTNEKIGGFLAPQDVATRDEYVDEGGWAAVGRLVNDNGRGLPIHRLGEGWEQTLQNHDGIGGIYVPDSIGDAFWVQPEFWEEWATLGGATGYIKYPIGDQISPCPAGPPDPCVSYQPFECGVIYHDGAEVQSYVTCTYEGIYAITGGVYRHLDFGASSWETVETDPGPGGSQNLKVFGDFMIHKEGTGAVSFRVSLDGGQTWSVTEKPPLQSDGNHYHPVDADLCPDGRLWLAWQRYSGGGTLNRIAIYYSDPADSYTAIHLSSDVNIGGIGGGAAHPNGGVSCHETDPNRVAVVMQRGTGGRVRLTTNGGGSWQNYTPGGFANAYRIVWSGSRLLLVYDGGSSFAIRGSDNDGVTWTTLQTFSQPGSNRTDKVDVIRTPVQDLLFAFVNDPGGVYILRSTNNGTSWQPVSAFPSFSAGSPNALAYDADSDHLYVSWSYVGRNAVLPSAGTRDWTQVAASDWVILPQIGSDIALRAYSLDGSGAIGLLGP